MQLHSIKYPRHQSGDTIIEVLMAMAIIGLTLGIAYGIANKAVLTGRNAQERSEAVKIAESQIERLKGNITTTNYRTGSPSPFCIIASNPRADATAPECTAFEGGFYKLSMIYVPESGSTPEVFKSIVTWVDLSKDDNTDAGLADDDPNLIRNRVIIPYRP